MRLRGKAVLGALGLGSFLSACNVAPTEDEPRDPAPDAGEAKVPPSADAGSPQLLLFTDPGRPLPETLGDVGLFDDLDIERPSTAAIDYTPRAELWSNGLGKRRLLVLPPDETVDPRETPWQFPPGTLFFKTFTDLDGPVETRVLRHTGDNFEYAVYRWSDGDARLLDGRLNVDVEVRTRGGLTPHVIPSHLTCKQCHESSDSQILGFRALELWDAELTAPERVFSPVPSFDDPIAVEDETTRRVLDYFVGNCVHCHNGSIGLASSFDLRPEVALENIIDRPTESNSTAPGIRVVPGDPLASILFQAVSGEGDATEVKNMPPEGVQVRDSAAVDLLRSWIDGL